MKRILLILLALSSFGALAQVSDSFEQIDIFDLEYVSDPQISPDGKKIVYVRNFKDVMTDRNLSNLWITNYDGTSNIPLTTGNQNDTHPRWSNDGKLLSYKSNKDGSTQIYMKWLESGAEAKLTNINQGTGAVQWSPDDKFLAFTMFVPGEAGSAITLPSKPQGANWNKPPIYIDDLNYRADGRGYLKRGYRQLFVLSTDGGTPRQLTFEDYDYGSPVWAHDGKSLIFSANLKEDAEYDPVNSEIYSLSLSNGSVKTLTSRNGPDNSPIVSPDGKKIAYLGFDDKMQGYQVTKLYIMNIDGSGAKLVSNNLDRDVAGIQWSWDGRGVYFQYDDKGDTKLAYMSTAGKLTPMTDHVGGLSLGRPYSGGSFSVSQNSRYAYTLAGTDHPADLGVGDKTVTKRITNLNADLFDYKKLGEVEEVWFKSSYDNRDIQGWIVKPPNFNPNQKYPLILEIHGGPFATYGSFFSAEIQLYAASGYVVLYTNPRGSTSYGEEFGNLIHHNYPNQDYDDLMSGVDAVIEKGYVDPNRLFVTGGSGGGVLTAWIVGKTERFAAAVVAKPVINWYSFVLYADGPAFFHKYWFPGFPWDHQEHYMKRSPLSLVGNVTTPTMLLTGESDFRTPIAESEQYYAALKLRKVESAMVRIPGASHGIAARPSNLIAKVASILTWFKKYDE